jgi:uncharacterized damage-inducible protein DinB
VTEPHLSDVLNRGDHTTQRHLLENLMDSLLAGFRTTTKILNIALAGLSDAEAHVRTRGDEGPSISWTVGHLLDSRVKVLALLGEVRPNPYATPFGSAAATDGAHYPTLASMLAEWTQLHETLETVAARAGDTIHTALSGAGAHGETHVRDQLAFLAWHEGYHVGVIGAARKAAGLLGPAELIRAAQLAG